MHSPVILRLTYASEREKQEVSLLTAIQQLGSNVVFENYS